MKVKRIILSMVSALVLVALFFSSNVFAYDQINETFMEINAESVHNLTFDNPEYGLGQDGPGITQIGNENGERLLNFYCALADVGFEARNKGGTEHNVDEPYYDTYRYKYNMSSPLNNADKNSITSMYSTNYKKILAVADLFYLGDSNEQWEAYLKDLFDRDILYDNDEETFQEAKNAGILITPNQIRATQQAALWYFTNGGTTYDKTGLNDNNSFLYYRAASGNYSQLRDSESTSVRTKQDQLALQLYKYLINKANEATDSYVSKNQVNLYTKKTIEGELAATYKEKSQPIIEIIPAPKQFDLALRKFIVKITDSTGENNRYTETELKQTREPKIDGDRLDVAENPDEITYEKSHSKIPLDVAKGDIVTYKIRIYNEGEKEGTATIITDYLPDGLEFIENDFNTVTNKWTKDSTGKIITSTKLERETILPCDGDGSKLNNPDYYRDVEIQCRVTGTSNKLKNIAEITEDNDDDVDSVPGQNRGSYDYYGGNSSEGRGKEDDDDFEDLKLKKFDLALRKFITKIANDNGTDLYSEEDYAQRVPEIGDKLQEGIKDGEITYTKEHSKLPLGVSAGNIVTYTIRVYNEGEIAGKVTKITDFLPEGLELYTGEGNINSGVWSNPSGDKKTYVTDSLKNTVLQPCNGDYTKLNEAGYYADVKVQCVVTGTSNKLKNIAEITEDSDDDVDSVPGENRGTYDYYQPDENGKSKGRGNEDDDDFENLKLQEFDLALRKYITKVENEEGQEVTVSNIERTPDIDTTKLDRLTDTTAEYKHRKDPVVVKPGYFVYYNLTVYNEGDIAGYAKTITDILPAGVKFIDVVDKTKYVKDSYNEESNIVVLKATDRITSLRPYDGKGNLDSETVTIKCEVTADKETGAEKIYTNIAWISEDYNEKGAKDRDSKTSEHPTESNLVTNYPDNGYINEKDNKNKDLSNPEEYFKGEQDDDDFEKIIIYKGPEIHKGVKTVKNQDSGYDDDVNTPHEWVINSSLPINVKDYKKYVIVDDIDYRLVYGNVKSVNIIDKSGKKVAELKEGNDKDYIVEYKENKSSDVSEILGNKYSGTLKLTFIDTNKAISDAIKANGGNIIEVKFTTTFAKDENGKLLAIGKEIPNKAELEYVNESNDNGKEESEKPEVHTGGITLFKYRTSNNKKVGLKDAEFEIYRNKKDAEKKENAVQKAKSGKNGLVEFVGLEYGEDAQDDEKNKQPDGTYDHDSNKLTTTYWIVETKAPKGYKTITDVIEVKIGKDSYKDDVEVLIKEEESKKVTNRLIENKPLDFDLALRKFITKVEDKEVTTRVPEVKYKDGKISYEHTKDPVNVVNGNVVTYTLRIFNEGQINGYASVITDDIPDGLEFLPEHDTNKEYRWVMYRELKDNEKVEDESKVVECKVNGSKETKKYIETKKAKEAAIIRTDYLSKEQGEERMSDKDKENPNLLKAFNPNEKISDTNPDHKDVEVAFRVIEPNGSKRILINYAQISDDTDEEGEEVDDIDSTPDVWNEGEDDQDIEKVKVPLFDLALRKWVTQAIVIENGKETVTNTGHDAWDDPEEIVKVELHRKKLTNVTVKFRYSIRVYNQGEIDGYAKEITDYIPTGLKFVAEDNPDWVDEGNNVISTRKLENTLLKAKEGYADVEVLLTWINGTDNLGLKVNTAEISEDYNEEGVPDCDSVPDNKKPGEDDIDDAPVMLSVSTGMEATYIILGTSILLIIAGGIFLIKKYVL